MEYISFITKFSLKHLFEFLRSQFENPLNSGENAILEQWLIKFGFFFF